MILAAVDTVGNRMGRLFGRSLIPWAGEETLTATKWIPLVDVSGNDKEFTIKADFFTHRGVRHCRLQSRKTSDPSPR
jgi:hypothetical protein